VRGAATGAADGLLEDDWASGARRAPGKLDPTRLGVDEGEVNALDHGRGVRARWPRGRRSAAGRGVWGVAGELVGGAWRALVSKLALALWLGSVGLVVGGVVVAVGAVARATPVRVADEPDVEPEPGGDADVDPGGGEEVEPGGGDDDVDPGGEDDEVDPRRRDRTGPDPTPGGEPDVDPGGAHHAVDPARAAPDVEPDGDYDDVEPPVPVSPKPKPGRAGASPAGKAGGAAGSEPPSEGRGGRDGGGDAQPKDRPRLPPRGRAVRPTLPHIDRDLILLDGGVVGQGQAQLSLNRMGEDLFLFLNLGTVIVADDWRVAPRLPIRFRILDEAPESPYVIREHDWDEASDWAKLLAFVQYGHQGDPLFVRYGELTGLSLGHGSFVNRYYNTVDIDHYQGGIYFQGDASLVGGELLIDNLFGPELGAARVFGRPLNWVPGLPLALSKLKVALTAGADFNAPLEVGRDSAGRIVIDEDFHPSILSTDAVWMLGGDLELPLASTPHFDLVPYMDVNALDMTGVGVHLGTFVNLRFSPLASLRTRVEYRYMGPDYEAGYFSPFYEIQRVSHRQDKTKLRWLREGGLPHGRSGGYFETELQILGMLRYMLVISDEEGPDNTDLLMRLRLPHLGPVRLALFLGRLGFDGFDDLLSAKRTVFAASIRYSFLDWFFVKASVTNEWWLRHATDGASAYETTTDFDFGGGLLVKL